MTNEDKILSILERHDKMFEVLIHGQSTLIKDVGELKEDVAVLKEDVAELKEDVAGLKKDVASLNTRVTALEDGLQTTNSKLTRLHVIVENDIQKTLRVIAEGNKVHAEKLEALSYIPEAIQKLETRQDLHEKAIQKLYATG